MRKCLTGALLLTVLGVRAQDPVQLKLVNWANGLSNVVDLTHAGDSRLFAVQRQGIIRIISDSMQVIVDPFLDIQDSVNSIGGEQGLLGLAFDPDYTNNGYFYVYYIADSGPGTSRVSRFRVSNDPDSADAASEEILYTWPQPFTNHNGGDLDFGPDGLLYVGFGDGGSGGDPQDNAQDLTDPLGDIIRLDVSDPDTTWTIPATNPWASAQDTLPEIWASGVRNPYRFGFDALTGDLWMGDVGQNAWEEVDFWPAGDNSGPNFGWRCYEGDTPFNTQGCQGMSNYEFPVTTHENVATGGTWCSSIGGRVYRGTVWPHLYGRYIYTDYCAGEFWVIRPDGSGGWIDELGLNSGSQGYVVIAEDVNGELFAGNTSNGQVKKIVDKCPMDPPSLTQNGNTVESTLALTYQWYLNGVLVSGETAQTFSPASNGVVHVVATYAGPCTLTSDTLNFVGDGLLETPPNGFRVYPQPAQVALFIDRDDHLSGTLRAELVDGTGRTILDVPFPQGQRTLRLDLGAAKDGIYVLVLRDSSGSSLGRTPVAVR
ncbi:MAG: PQQ-dependent sugar dehydrogenase [Flavobacteriales bacterium]|nr:PQQ-dependent sugar dehydrogenase [Flavobacteriales bacterium]MBK9537871.1 PQQ-dependent sugar dehydrogenase [Flavobacteriales bacterium]